ncbi:phosphoesterase family-domain-containing protein [Mycena galericulata]|nr:phosphoesterase family-domain-containing protein [Mycena galericulata]
MSPARTLLPALLAAASLRLASAATAQTFVPASKGPLVQTANYTSFSNSTLNDKKVVKGKAFSRFVYVWLENTDFETAASTPLFESLAEQGIVLTNYNSVTHPSEPNYIASVGGDFFGAHDDNMYHIPSNISCVVDLLEDKGVSWATYQENMPTDEYYGVSYTAPNYASPASAPYPYYMRKHNPLMVYDAVSQDPQRVARIRTFNDFANDVVNGTLPQWVFVTPNMVDDAHDTTIDFAASFLEYWLLPLISDPRVVGGNSEAEDQEGEGTLIIVTFDESETYTEQNRVFAVALGTAIPPSLRGTTDDTLYSHYSLLSTVQNNWGLKSLGRQDTNASIANVFSFVADKTGYKNTHIPRAPCRNSLAYTPFAAPNLNAHGAGSGGVLLRPGLDTHLTQNKLPAPVDLSAENKATPWQMSPETVSGKNIIPCANAACA